MKEKLLPTALAVVTIASLTLNVYLGIKWQISDYAKNKDAEIHQLKMDNLNETLQAKTPEATEKLQ